MSARESLPDDAPLLEPWMTVFKRALRRYRKASLAVDRQHAPFVHARRVSEYRRAYLDVLALGRQLGQVAREES